MNNKKFYEEIEDFARRLQEQYDQEDDERYNRSYRLPKKDRTRDKEKKTNEINRKKQRSEKEQRILYLLNELQNEILQ